MNFLQRRYSVENYNRQHFTAVVRYYADKFEKKEKRTHARELESQSAETPTEYTVAHLPGLTQHEQTTVAHYLDTVLKEHMRHYYAIHPIGDQALVYSDSAGMHLRLANTSTDPGYPREAFHVMGEYGDASGALFAFASNINYQLAIASYLRWKRNPEAPDQAVAEYQFSHDTTKLLEPATIAAYFNDAADFHLLKNGTSLVHCETHGENRLLIKASCNASTVLSLAAKEPYIQLQTPLKTELEVSQKRPRTI